MHAIPFFQSNRRGAGRHLAGCCLLAVIGLTLACGGGGGAGSTPAASVSSPSAPSAQVAYPVSTVVVTQGSPLVPMVPTVTAPTISFAISPALPSGLGLDATSGSISGTPTQVAPAALYTVTADLAAGAATATITLSVVAPAGSTGLAYPQTTVAATVGQAITPDTPTVTGTASAFAVAPALPAGLSLNPATGVISGTPTVASASAAYVVTATLVTGPATATVSISATAATAPPGPPAAPTGLSYPSGTIAATVGQAIATDAPTLTNSVNPTFTIAPALPAGLSINAGTGAISGAPTSAFAATSFTVTAADATGSDTAAVVISATAQSAPASNVKVPGFAGLYQYFPSSSGYASSKTAATMAANPWMKGARFSVNQENLCQDSVLPLADWNSDVASVTGFTDPLNTVMIRMKADPDGAWNAQSAAAATDTDAVVAGIVAVGNAAQTTNYLLDLENYSTSYLLNNYNQTSAGDPILDSPAISRAAMCAKLQAYGKAYGTSLWNRVPNATLYTFFGPTMILQFNGTSIPSTFPDSSYASDPRYNMMPYFFLGLLDACPATGHIADYMEHSYYDFAGLASLKREMTASKNWVSIYFPAQTALIAKAATSWVPVPLIFPNPYFQSSYGSIYPGAAYVTSAADQLAMFTRNALYCLQETPVGYLPGVYIEGYDPWGAIGSVSNIPAAWATGLNNAMAVYKGTTTLANLFNASTLDSDLEKDFAGNSTWVAECQ